MSTTTTNLGLTKPELDEQYQLGVWNGNSDILDEFAGDVNEAMAEIREGAEAASESILKPGTGQADMTNAILGKLQSTGACVLQAGDYYVSGVTMPSKTTISGAGKKTRVILLDSVTNGAAIKMASECTVQNITIYGGENTVSSTVGTRHGILWQGTGSSSTSPFNGLVAGCMIKGFSGGGITCSNTSTGTVNHLTASNCFIQACNAGLNIQASAEFNKFSSIRTYACYYSCINLGGNNTFIGCDFSRSTVGMQIGVGVSTNNGHGSAVGCIFNHIGDNVGTAVSITGTQNGFTFVGCQFFYGGINITNAGGVIFSGCLFGKDAAITVMQADSAGTGSKASNVVDFSHCSFANRPVVTPSDNTKFTECYTRDGERVWYRNLLPFGKGDSNNSAKTFKGTGIRIPAGDYELFFQSMTSTDTDADTCRVRFYDDDLNGVSSYYQIPRGQGVHIPVTLTGTATQVWIIPSSATGTIGEDDALNFTGAMLCTAAEWARSQTYTPYIPTNEELFLMLQSM